jgi:hypothetical protein
MAENKDLERELEQLDLALSILKRDFEIYFAGGIKLPPLEAQRRIERAIRKYSNITNLNYAQRFRYNNLSARFNSYADLWNKQMKYKEEGRTPSGAVIQVQVQAPPPPKEKKQARRASGDSETAKYQKLFNEYLQSREKTGETASGVSFDKFSQQLAKQKETIVGRYQCKDVEFYVAVEQGKTKLKAKPIK